MNNTNTNNNDNNDLIIMTILFRAIYTIDCYRYCRKVIMSVFR